MVWVERRGRAGWALTWVWARPLTGHCSALAVSLELGDVSLVPVPPEGLQPAPGRGSQGQLIAHLQELLHHWVLWSAVKSRWVIVGKWALHPPSSLSCSFSPVSECGGADSPKEHVGVGSPPHPANELKVRDLGWHPSLALSLTSSLCEM